VIARDAPRIHAEIECDSLGRERQRWCHHRDHAALRETSDADTRVEETLRPRNRTRRCVVLPCKLRKSFGGCGGGGRDALQCFRALRNRGRWREWCWRSAREILSASKWAAMASRRQRVEVRLDADALPPVARALDRTCGQWETDTANPSSSGKETVGRPAPRAAISHQRSGPVTPEMKRRSSAQEKVQDPINT